MTIDERNQGRKKALESMLGTDKKEELKRPVKVEDLKSYVKQYLNKNTPNDRIKEKVMNYILNSFDFQSALNVANNKEYSIKTIKKELDHTFQESITFAHLKFILKNSD